MRINRGVGCQGHPIGGSTWTAIWIHVEEGLLPMPEKLVMAMGVC